MNLWMLAHSSVAWTGYLNNNGTAENKHNKPKELFTLQPVNKHL